MNGRLTLSAKATGTARTGTLVAPTHGVEIPGIDLTGLTFLAGIHLASLSTGTSTSINLGTLVVTENGATSTDEGVDLGGAAVSVDSIRFLALVPDAGNDASIEVSSEIMDSRLNPGGLLLGAFPTGFTGSDLSTPLAFSPADTGQGVTVYVWGTRS